MKLIYRGVWADRLENGQDLPIGKRISGCEEIVLNLDFGAFDSFLEGWCSPKMMSEFYKKHKNLKAKLKKAAIDINPYLFFICDKVGKKVRDILNPEYPPDNSRRVKKFRNNRAKLSDMCGVAMCAEQAALGQYLLQNVLEEEYNSSFVSGVEYQYLKAKFEAHSFLVLKNKDDNTTFVYDISRPLDSKKPRIFETDIPFKYEFFEDRWDNLVVGATEVLHGERSYFGIGDSMHCEPFLEKK